MPTARPRLLVAAGLAVAGAIAIGVAAVGLAGVSGDDDTEEWRPVLHFTPSQNWMNDPNGPLEVDGRFHLFYQYNPDGDLWGNIGWGHAVSDDTLRWDERGVAIPADDTTMIFSGSAVHDAHDTSGRCGEAGCIVAVYTEHVVDEESTLTTQRQSVAFSHDGGETFEPYEGNPVIDIDHSEFRDPNVFWHEPSRHWVMTVALPVEREVALYRSPNLLDWEHTSTFGPAGFTGGIWECPTLVELPVEGEPDETAWLMKIDHNPGHLTGGSGAQYFVGRFDGVTFEPDDSPEEVRWVDHGPDFYCAMPFSHSVDEQGRRTWIAWMSNWEYASDVPTAPWRGAMTLPRTMDLIRDGEVLALRQSPVPSLDALRTNGWAYDGDDLATVADLVRDDGVAGDTLDIVARIHPGDADEIAIGVRTGEDEATVVGYDARRGALFVDRRHSGTVDFHPDFGGVHTAPVAMGGDPIELRIVVDRSSVEVFAAGGRVVFTELVFPDPGSVGVELHSSGDTGPVSLEVWELDTGDD